MKCLAIDIGSSFIKAAALDLDANRIVSERKLPTPPKSPSANPRHFTVPADLFVAATRELAEACADGLTDIGGLFLATQMHGVVYSVPNRRDFYLSWQDSRCLESRREGGYSYLEILRGALSPGERAGIGAPLKPSFGLCNLFALLDREPSLPRNGVLHTLGSYVISRLTGENVCHLTNAAALGMADLSTGAWNQAILKKAGLGEITLPKIAGGDWRICGSFRLGGRETPVYPDYGDQQAAILGCLPRPGDAVINIATGAQVAEVADAPPPGPYEVRPYFAGRRLKTIAGLPSGRNLDVLVNFIRQAASAVAGAEVSSEAVWRAVRAGLPADPAGLSVDARFHPLNGYADGGSVSGVGPANLTLANLFSAAFMDLAGIYRENIDTLCGLASIQRLICSGGVSWRNPELVDAIRRLTGKECVLSPLPDESMSGLFRAALAAFGAIDSLEDRPELVLQPAKDILSHNGELS